MTRTNTLEPGSRDYRFLQARQMAKVANAFLGKTTLIRSGWGGGEFGGKVSHSRRFQVRVDASRDIGLPICSGVDWTGEKNSGLEGSGSQFEYHLDIPLAGWESFDALTEVVRQVMDQFRVRSERRPEYYEFFWNEVIQAEFLQQLRGTSLANSPTIGEDPLYGKLAQLQIPDSVHHGDVLRAAARRIGLVHQLLGNECQVVYSYKGPHPIYDHQTTLRDKYGIFLKRFDAHPETSTLNGPFSPRNWRYGAPNYFLMALALEDTLDPTHLAETTSQLLTTKLGEKKVAEWRNSQLPIFTDRLKQTNVYALDDSQVVIHDGTLLNKIGD